MLSARASPYHAPMRQAAILVGLVTAGCGNDPVHHLPDGPPAIDGSAPIDAAPSPVTLTVTNAGAPVAGVHVWFQEHDSTLVSSTMTDATGVASAIVLPGAFVTALDPFPQAAPSLIVATGSDDLRTFAGVKPGDHLVLDQPANGMSITFTVTGPIDPGATTYTLFSSCGSSDLPTNGSGSPPTNTVNFQGCGSAADMLIESFDGVGGVREVVFVPNVPVADGGTVDLSASVYVDQTDATFTYSNAPASIPNIEIQPALAGAHGIVFTSFGNVDTTTGAGTTTITLPGGTGAIGIEDSTTRNGISQQDVVDWGPFAAAYTLDLASALLADFTERPSFDAANHAIAWTESTGAAPDFTIVQFEINRDPTFWTWEIAAPYTAGTVVLPVLPADGATFNALATDTSNFFSAESAKVPGGYDAVRANVLSNLGTQAMSFVAGATGLAVVVRPELAKGLARHRRRL
jgi:hypothetical protein